MLVKVFAQALGVMAVMASPFLIGVAFVYVAALRRRRRS